MGKDFINWETLVREAGIDAAAQGGDGQDVTHLSPSYKT